MATTQSSNLISLQVADAPHSLLEVLATLEHLCSRNHGTKISVGDVVQALGPRSFAPFILAIGLIALTPIDTIPTLPTTFGVIVFLTASQMLAGRKALWLPQILSNRSVKSDRLKKALEWLDAHLKWTDRWLGIRLTLFTRGPFLIAIAACCALLALIMPLLELVPLVSTIPSAAFTAFGLALLVRDGIAALVGFTLTGITLIAVFELARIPFS
jgi:hypothetical protein